ncbi:bifunctional riboflavin kinase/FAD synthetase [Paenibacillus sp. FSL H8-0548]|uniref:bifunctional riboflavin kinase/FAD synthetase n=1 Tax=Paenibacillus sp. FSL H8-0548 TaxID=1920422 RepID=UPI0009F89FD1|nr:bifunctional riboflavin kinase/FAD synthetase [Paenibacillus sp. FSL H8-0548]
MEIIPLSFPLNGLSMLSLDKPLSIAIGHFDGVHRGHQNVIRQAVAEAKESEMLSAVLTFDPHPKEVLGQGDHYYRCLTPLDVKTALFEKLGVDLVFIMRFDLEFAEVTPERFVNDVLRVLRAKQVVVGFDFNFGHRGLGNTETLMQLGQPDISVHVIEPLIEKGIKVSSTYIREALEAGDFELAHSLLGRSYEVKGIVVHGDKRGRTIGFPTANLQINDPYIAPRIGVYAITAWIGEKAYSGVLNYGLKPTFNKNDPHPIMEAHLFDFNGDIYGEQIRLQFISFIRAEIKFNSIDDLIKQIEADSERAKEILGYTD